VLTMTGDSATGAGAPFLRLLDKLGAGG
jgi:hypothetical protein